MLDRDTLQRKFSMARAYGFDYMLVLHDIVGYYTVRSKRSMEDVMELVRVINTQPGMRVHEVYKLALGWEAQKEGRAWNI